MANRANDRRQERARVKSIIERHYWCGKVMPEISNNG
jgi:hypothetical protein